MKKSLFVSLVASVCIFVLPQIIAATSWAYAFVVWNGATYVITDEVVSDVGKKIGKVTRYSDMEPKGGNFSNHFEKGTAYYSIEGVATTEAIAVEAEKNYYVKAIYNGEYAYAGSLFDKGKTIFFVMIVACIAFIAYYIVPSFKKT